jgi:2-polyprenyl-3-methyl-5-hydroxy-6-metoxy-1,4-benzoquinol methylase
VDSKNKEDWLLGGNVHLVRNDFSEQIAFDDHKTKFVVNFCKGKDVLDVGCVQHNPENYKSKFWLHKALREISGSIVGMDLYEPGVAFLRDHGFNVIVGDAQSFDLGKQFDVIVAGDLIEHLGNLNGFLESCKKHLKPDGVLLISTPNPWYWRNVVKAALHASVSNNPEHTMWLCPVTLRQLAARHGLTVTQVEFGSRYKRDTLMPLPKGVKHTSFHAVLKAG